MVTTMSSGGNHQAPPIPPTLEVIREALYCIPADIDRDTWARVAMALKSELGADALDIFDTWSQQSGNYNRQDSRDTWKSVKAGGGVGIKTLFFIAKDYGWRPAEQAPLSRDQQVEIDRRREQRKADAEKEQQRKEQRQAKAKRKAASDWGAAKAADDNHGYLQRKRIKAYGLRCMGEALLVPLCDPVSGELWNLQSIYPVPRSIRGSKEPRDKDFIPGGRKSGLCHIVGNVACDGPLVIAEGYATAATVHAATGWPVFVALDSGNLARVAEAVRSLHPERGILFAADNDQWTKNNPGVTKAKAAAKAVRGMVAVPQFEEAETQGKDNGPTDYNDLHLLRGLDAVREELHALLSQGQRRSLPPGFEYGKRGVFYDDPDNPQGRIWVCSPLEVAAVTRDDKGKEWGRLLVFPDMDGKTHRWSMPMSLLAGDGNECRRVLMNMGLTIGPSPKARNLLSRYIQTCEPESRARSVSRTGWYERAFVLPDEVIGEPEGERVLLQTATGEVSGYGCKGKLDAWRHDVAAYCAGNSRLALAVSVAFAPVLQELVQMESGGFHFRGNSSIGKSTMLYAAASVWGGAERVRRWRTTDNGLEGLAQAHNDSLLCLDELKELDPRDAGKVVYMLANGQGKQRAGRDGEQRDPATWRLIFVSTGELSIADHIRDGGGRVFAGQEVRIADIPADAGAGLGVFDTLHDMPSGVHLSQHLVQAAKRAYGVPSREFIRHVVADMEGVAVQVQELRRMFAEQFVPAGSDGQVYRVADRFALVAAAGELATEWGITGWEAGEATIAAQACFADWVGDRGGVGRKEDTDITRRVRRFLQEHGDARFVPMEGGGEFRTQYRAGYRGKHGGEMLYYVLSEVFTGEVCKGMDARYSAKVLQERGHLFTSEAGRLQMKMPTTPDDGTRPRVYAIRGSILEE